ncbi:MAG: VOC family protein [Deltaproteobacteria bacterium]|nr:VOC family protein [Deltaproteobacteria bacterium]
MGETDARPPVWIGHVTMGTCRLAESYEFMQQLGLRAIERGDAVGILELRGGTHLVLLPSDGPAAGSAPFDLMVEDVNATHARLSESGLAPSAIRKTDFHDSFTVRDPSGLDVTINSSHVSDLPV